MILRLINTFKANIGNHKFNDKGLKKHKNEPCTAK